MMDPEAKSDTKPYSLYLKKLQGLVASLVTLHSKPERPSLNESSWIVMNNHESRIVIEKSNLEKIVKTKTFFTVDESQHARVKK